MNDPEAINEEPLTHPLMNRGKEIYEAKRSQEIAEAIRLWLKRKTLDYRPSGIGNLTMAKVVETIAKALISDKQIFFSVTANPEAPL